MKNSTNKFLIAAVILLLIANIVLVFFMMKEKDGPGREREGGKSAFSNMAKEMEMTGEQQQQYDSLKEAHFKSIRPLFDSIRTTRQNLYNLIKEETINDSLVQVYTNLISEKQIEADRKTLYHFHQVRNLFSPSQQVKFDGFTQKMMQRRKRDSSDRKKEQKSHQE